MGSRTTHGRNGVWFAIAPLLSAVCLVVGEPATGQTGTPTLTSVRHRSVVNPDGDSLPSSYNSALRVGSYSNRRAFFPGSSLGLRTPSTANTVYIGCGGPNPFHDWYLLYADNPIWTITGTIYKSTELNNGGNFWDGDWSIYIHPADDFALRNPGAGKTNGDPWIEAEVMTHSWPIARSM